MHALEKQLLLLSLTVEIHCWPAPPRATNMNLAIPKQRAIIYADSHDGLQLNLLLKV